MIKLCCTILLLISALQLPAQEIIAQPKEAKLLTSFPFKHYTGGVMIVRAKFDNVPDTLNFILDTGSGGISLDSATCAEFNTAVTPTDTTITGMGGVRKVPFVFNRTLHLPGLSIEHLNFHVNDYDVLTSVYGEKIDGIIGYSVLSRYIVKIDYDSLKLDFCSRGTLRYPRGGFLLKPIMSTLPVNFARVKDGRTITARFLHDIGAGVCLMLSKDFAEDSTILNKKRRLWAKEGEGVGGKIDMHLTVIKELKFGPYRFRNVPTYIFDDVFNVTSYPYLGGLIGNDILRRFNTIINYEKKDIYLVPNSHFRDPFDYSYSGIELYYVNGVVIIGDVAKGSPAEQAGLEEGDIVIAINNNFSQNLNQYKTTLQAAAEKIRIIVRRNEELKQFDFRVKNIL